MADAATALVEHLQQAIVKPDLRAVFQALNEPDVRTGVFDTQTEAHDETVLSTFVQLEDFTTEHGDVLEALLARGFDPTYGTSSFFTPSEELEKVPRHLHELLSRAPDGFQPRWLDTPLDQLDQAFGIAATAPAAASAPAAGPSQAAARPEVNASNSGGIGQGGLPANTPKGPRAQSRPAIVTPPPPSGPSNQLLRDSPQASLSPRSSGTPPPPPRDVSGDVSPSRRPATEQTNLERSRRYENMKMPPAGWVAAWQKTGRGGPAPCGALFIRGFCNWKNGRETCPFSHAPLPDAFQHGDIIPDARREEDRYRDGKRSRSRSPSGRDADRQASARRRSPVRAESTGRINGREIFQQPLSPYYKTRYCYDRVRGCPRKEACSHAHTTAELEYYKKEQWRKVAASEETAGSSTTAMSPALKAHGAADSAAAPPTDLAVIDTLDLSDAEKRLIIDSIMDPSSHMPGQPPPTLRATVAFRKTTTEEAAFALADPAPAFPDDPATQERYRSYLRMSAGDGDMTYIEPILVAIAAYNDRLSRWTERAHGVAESSGDFVDAGKGYSASAAPTPIGGMRGAVMDEPVRLSNAERRINPVAGALARK